MNKDEIINRLQEHYDYLIKQGHEVVAVILRGSQNYGLDLYTKEYMSDIDSKAIVVPSFDDFVYNKSPFSHTYILDNEEHIDTKDIRIMCDMWRKENISYIELLYSKYMIINPEYEDIINALIEYRDRIVEINSNQFIRCIYGMGLKKQKALCHPYPATKWKIDKWGYDGKQLSHLVRLEEFLTRYLKNTPIKDCYISEIPNYLIAIKQNIDMNGKEFPLKNAKLLAEQVNKNIKYLKDKYTKEEDKINTFGIALLEETKYEILKKKFKKDLKNT